MKSILNIKLMKWPILVCYYGEQNSNCVNFSHKRERFRIIHSISLSIPLFHESSFVSFDSAISLVFDGINPSASNCLLSFRQLIFFPSFIFVKNNYFLFHCLLSFWISESLINIFRYMLRIQRSSKSHGCL